VSSVTPTGAAPVAPQAPPPPPVPAQAAPAVARQLDPGTSLRGQILGHTSDRALIAQTDAGRIQVKLPHPLPPGTRVKIDVVQTQPELKVVVSQTAGKGAQTPLPPAVVAPRVAGGSTAPLPQPGTVLQGTLTPARGQGTGAAPVLPPSGAAAVQGTAVAQGTTPATPTPSTGTAPSGPQAPAAPAAAKAAANAVAPPAGAGARGASTAPAPATPAAGTAPGGTTPAPGPSTGATVPSGTGTAPAPSSSSPISGGSVSGGSVSGGSPSGGSGTPTNPTATVRPTAAAPVPPAQDPAPRALGAGTQTPPTESAQTRSQPPASGSTTGSAQNQAGPVAPRSAHTGLPGLGKGVEVTLRVVQATPPAGGQAASPAATTTGSAGSIQAQVTGHTAAGQTILTTPAGTLTLESGGRLAIGSNLTLQALGQDDGPAHLQGRGAGGDARAAVSLQSSNLARSLPSLEQIMQTLATADAAAAQTVLQNSVARPGPQLTGALLFFMTALRGDARVWVGDTASRLLDRSAVGKAALDQLGEDFGGLTRTGRDAQGTEWRAFYVPVFDGEQYDQLRLYLRQPAEDGDAGGEGRGGARFLMDVTLTRLGPLQLDGLVRDQRVDLMLRTARPLPEAIRAGVSELYTETMERTGYTGKITFQHLPELPPLPFPDDGPPARRAQNA